MRLSVYIVQSFKKNFKQLYLNRADRQESFRTEDEQRGLTSEETTAIGSREMKYSIIMQEESHGKDKIEVACKNVRMFPIEKKGQVVGFGSLGFLLLQIIIADEKGNQIKLKLSTSEGIMHPKFVVQFPDTMEYDTYVVGYGKNRRVLPDTLAPMVKKPGRKDEYNQAEFEKMLTRMVGAELADNILQLFAERFAEVALKKAA